MHEGPEQWPVRRLLQDQWILRQVQACGQAKLEQLGFGFLPLPTTNCTGNGMKVSIGQATVLKALTFWAYGAGLLESAVRNVSRSVRRAVTVEFVNWLVYDTWAPKSRAACWTGLLASRIC